MVAASTSAADAPDLTDGGTVHVGDIELPFTAAGAETFWFRLKRPANLDPASAWWLCGLIVSGMRSTFYGALQREYQYGVYFTADEDPDTSSYETSAEDVRIDMNFAPEPDQIWMYLGLTLVEPEDHNTMITWLAYNPGTDQVNAGTQVFVNEFIANNDPDLVYSYTRVQADPTVIGPRPSPPPEQIFGATLVFATGTVPLSVIGVPEPCTGGTSVTAEPSISHSPRVITGEPELARGHTDVSALVPERGATPDPITGTTGVRVIDFAGAAWPDDASGSTTVTVSIASDHYGTPDLVAGSTLVRVIVVPDMSDNEPITLAIDMHAELQIDAPDDAGELYTLRRLGQLDTPAEPNTLNRLTPLVAFAMPEPIIVAGKPVVPLRWAKLASSVTAIQGPKHIHAEDPAPVWDPTHNNFSTPPPDAPPWTGRWVVNDLPDPPTDGYYWLGDPTYLDGTGGYTGGRTRWASHASAPHAPAWRSFFPYKPSVRAFDSYLPNGDIVHHPKGVHFNSQYVEHMWADFGGPRRQPFTWVITGMIVSFPSKDYVHYILDAGRNPDSSHFPRQSASSVYNPHSFNENLNYRSLIAYSRHRQHLQSSGVLGGNANAVKTRVVPNTRPKMFFGVFNGRTSVTGAYSPHAKEHHTGRIADTDFQRHRFYVLGRAQNRISQDQASHMLIFELRYWRAALTLDELDKQYQQLASTYQFHRYKAV